MKLTFIEAPFDWTDRETKKVKNYGISRIAGYLVSKNILSKEDMTYVDFTFGKDYSLDKIPKSEFYGFSVMQPNYNSSLEIAKELKQRDPDCKIVFGGSAITDLGQEIVEVHDFVDFIGMDEDSFAKIIKGEEVVIEYPPKDWKEIMPLDLENDCDYIKNHVMLLASLGCTNKCNFCNLVISQPCLVKREDKYLIEEIKHVIKDEKISIQLIDQNFCNRLKTFLDNLVKLSVGKQEARKASEEDLIEKIKFIGFNSRADTVLKYYQDLVDAVETFSNIDFEVYVGFENYDDEELKRLNKGLTARTNIAATEKLIKLERENNNFRFVMSFIGYNKETTISNMKNNLDILKQLYFDTNYIKNIHWFFESPLRMNSPREKGHYPKQIYEMPEDEEMKKIILQYNEITKDLPSFTDRKYFYNQFNLKERNIFMVKNPKNMIFSEFLIMLALVNYDVETAKKSAKLCQEDFENLKKLS